LVFSIFDALQLLKLYNLEGVYLSLNHFLNKQQLKPLTQGPKADDTVT